MAKKFLFICLGILALAGAYAVGAGNSVAQTPRDTIAGVFNGSYSFITASGDIYFTGSTINTFYDDPLGTGQGTIRWDIPPTWTFMGNVWEQPIAIKSNSLGGVKSLFR